MTKNIKLRYVMTLSFVTFALFVGAGNIIFPPMVGLQAGKHVWTAAVGFLITAVGLPILTVIALVKLGGSIDNLSSPVGKMFSLIFATICYLTVGPMFAVPRTATVSFEIGVAPITGNSNNTPLLLYSILYFTVVMFISLNPNKILNTIGNFLAPLKVIALTILAFASIIWSPGEIISNTIEDYRTSAFTNGFINGYLTMDTLGAMLFSILIFNAAYSRGITEINLLIRYILWSCLIAGIGLTILYLALFNLGCNSATLVKQNSDGALILNAYANYIFGGIGTLLLTIMIFLACLITAVGLICSCTEFLIKYVNISYHKLVFILIILSMIISNLGLNNLIYISIPVLISIYPTCIVLVLLSFTCKFWNNYSKVIRPTVYVSLIFGIIDGAKHSILNRFLPNWVYYMLPLSEYRLQWIIPTLLTLTIFAIIDIILKYRKN